MNNDARTPGGAATPPPRLSFSTALSSPFSVFLPKSPRKSTPENPTPAGTPFTCIATLLNNCREIHSLAIGPRAFLYAGSGADDATVTSWRLPELTEFGGFRAGTGTVRALAAAGDNIISGHDDGKIRVWRRSRRRDGVHRRVAVLPEARGMMPRALGFITRRGSRTSSQSHMEAVTCLAYSSANETLYSGSWDSTIKVWSLSAESSWKCLQTLRGHAGCVNALALGEQRGIVFSASDDSTVKVWKRAGVGHDPLATLFVQQYPVKAVALALYGSAFVLYAGCSDGHIHRWLEAQENDKGMENEAFKYVDFVSAHCHSVTCLAVAGDWLISGSADTTVRVWGADAAMTMSCRAVLEGHRLPVKCVTACVDALCERLIVYSGGLDGDVHVWLGSCDRL